MKIRYKIILYYSQEDEAFIAEVPELPGCAADGENFKSYVIKKIQQFYLVMIPYLQLVIISKYSK
ncbi:MAG: type II toxin-antitoxin system HicB family antitoxin [Rivularia sp. (in: cyanobacteria)]